MNDNHTAGRYAIRIKGHLGEAWAARFDGMTVTRTPDGETILTGAVADQAALHGLLRTIRDSGLALIAVNRINRDEE
jgi:hypothetical protein